MAEQVQGQFGYQTVQLIKTQPLGTGSYGAVYKAKCDELPCAAKILHPTLFQFNDPGAMTVMRQFEQECNFLSAQHCAIFRFIPRPMQRGVQSQPIDSTGSCLI